MSLKETESFHMNYKTISFTVSQVCVCVVAVVVSGGGGVCVMLDLIKCI